VLSKTDSTSISIFHLSLLMQRLQQNGLLLGEGVSCGFCPNVKSSARFALDGSEGPQNSL
jgi:hypothetical protein